MIKKNDIKARNLKAIAGVQKYFPGASPLTLKGVAYAPADLVKLLQQQIDDADKADIATGVFHGAVSTQRATNKKVNPVYLQLRDYVLNQYGDDESVLAVFGYQPKKQPKVAPPTLTQASTKARATRQARHTMGSRQKRAVKGTVAGSGSAPATPATGTPAKA